MTFKNNFIWDNLALDWGLELENVLCRSFFQTLSSQVREVLRPSIKYQIFKVSKCQLPRCQLHMLQILCVANSICCKLHVLQIVMCCKLNMCQNAHFSNCMCYNLHLLLIAYVVNCIQDIQDYLIWYLTNN